MYLNKRIEEILKMLIDKDYLSIEEISKKLNISRRTTYYSMEKVEYYLTMNSIKLQKQRSLGYYLITSDKEKISKILSYSNEDYILSPNERYIKIIIYNYNHMYWYMYLNVIYLLKFNITLLIYNHKGKKLPQGPLKIIYMLVIFIINC